MVDELGGDRCTDCTTVQYQHMVSSQEVELVGFEEVDWVEQLERVV